jgi:hypothetical protein
VATPSCSSLDVFQDSCSSIFDWLLGTYKEACSHRDWSYKVVGITSNQVRRQFPHPIWPWHMPMHAPSERVCVSD